MTRPNYANPPNYQTPWSGPQPAPAPTAGGGYQLVYEVDFTSQAPQVFAGVSATIDGKIWSIYNAGGTFSGSISSAGLAFSGSAGGGSALGIALNDLGTCQANFRIWADMSFATLAPGSQVFSAICLNTGSLPADLDAQTRSYVGYFQDPPAFTSYVSNAITFPPLTTETAFALDVQLFNAGNDGFASPYLGAMAGGLFPPLGQCKNLQKRYVTGGLNKPGENSVLFYNYVTGGTFATTVRRLRVETL